MNNKKRLTHTLSKRNYNRLEQLKKNNTLNHIHITKSSLIDIALDYFFMELNNTPLEEIIIKTNKE